MGQKNTWHFFGIKTQCFLIVCNLWMLALINLLKTSQEDFKYLVKEFGSKNLELLKQKGDYPYEYMNSYERFNE